jgi:hypothetical protein
MKTPSLQEQIAAIQRSIEGIRTEYGGADGRIADSAAALDVAGLEAAAATLGSMNVPAVNLGGTLQPTAMVSGLPGGKLSVPEKAAESGMFVVSPAQSAAARLEAVTAPAEALGAAAVPAAQRSRLRIDVPLQG